jgi:hypothetical protein
MSHNVSNRNTKAAVRSVNSFITGETERKFNDYKQKDLNGLVCSSMFRDMTAKDDMRQLLLLLGRCFTLLNAELKINS